MARVFKKRAKIFHGIQYQHLPAGPSSPSVEAELVRPIPMETASSKKLAISPPSCTLLPSTSSAGESESYDYVGEKAVLRDDARSVPCDSQLWAMQRILGGDGCWRSANPKAHFDHDE